MNAVIFDMDGVVVDSVSHKHDHWARVLGDELGLESVETGDLIGLNSHDKYDYLVETAGLDVEKDEFLEVFDGNVERVYAEQVDLLADVESTIEWLADRGVKAALASASSRDRVELVVDRFGLTEALDAVVSADDVAGPSKPDPAIYEHAASLLGVDPPTCVAIEDSAHGVAAAKSAGTYCLGYGPSHHPPQNLESADEVVTTPEELHSRIRALIDGGGSGSPSEGAEG